MPPPRYSKRRQGTKVAMEMLKQVHIRDSASRAQAMATLEMEAFSSYGYSNGQDSMTTFEYTMCT